MKQNLSNIYKPNNKHLLSNVALVASVISHNMWNLFFFGGDNYETPDPNYEGSIGAHDLISEFAEPIAREFSEIDWNNHRQDWDSWVLETARKMYAERFPDEAYRLKMSKEDSLKFPERNALRPEYDGR